MPGSSSAYRSVLCFDNTVFPSSAVSLGEFRRLTNLTHKDADVHAEQLKAAAEADSAAAADAGATPPADGGGKGRRASLWDRNMRGTLARMEAEHRREEAAWRGRAEGLVAGALIGCLGGGGAVAHGAAAATLCTIS